MFQNYSQTYASQILSLAGFLILVLKALHVNIAENDLVLTLGALANIGGIGWALWHRYQKGDITPLGGRK